MAEGTQNINKLVTKENLAEFATGIDTKHKEYVDDIMQYSNKELNNNISMLCIRDSLPTNFNHSILSEIFPDLLNETYDVLKKCYSNLIVDGSTTISLIDNYNHILVTLHDENDNQIAQSYAEPNRVKNLTFNIFGDYISFMCFFDKAYDDTNTLIDSIGSIGFRLTVAKNKNTEEYINKIKNLKITIKCKNTKFLTTHNEIKYTPTSDYHPATKKYVDDSIKGVVFTSPFISTDWVLNPDTTFYELSVNHNLNSSNLSVFSRNTVDNYDMFVDYEIVDENNIKIISDEACDCSVKIHAY